MATIEFKDYIVDKMNYQENKNFDDKNTSLDLDVKFNAKVAFKKNKGMVSLTVKLGDEENTSCPFTVSIRVNGIFNYELNKDEEPKTENDDLRELMTTNAIAILYPYLRSLVSDITLRSNNYPVFILPVINVVEILKKDNSIEIIDLDILEDKGE